MDPNETLHCVVSSAQNLSFCTITGTERIGDSIAAGDFAQLLILIVFLEPWLANDARTEDETRHICGRGSFLLVPSWPN